MDNYTDETLMPFGKVHKGKRLIDVPASYLIWYLEDYEGLKDTKLIDYINDNKMCLLQEADLKNLKRW